MNDTHMTIESTKMAKFRTRLKEMREKKNWERADLLRESIVRGYDMTYQTIMLWENQGLSRIDANTAEVFAKVFDCEWHELFVMVGDN